MRLRLHEAVTVEFSVMLVGAMGQVTVNPPEVVVPDNEMVPAKLLTLVRETEMDPSFPKLMSDDVTLMSKSPTCTIAVALSEALPGVPFPMTMTW